MTMVWFRLLLLCLAGAGLVQDRADAQPAPPPPPASAPAAQPGAAVAPSSAPGAPTTPVSPAPQPGAGGSAASADPVIPVGRGGYVYLPEGRRDPFLSILRDKTGSEAEKKTDEINLPPLQRVSVAELTVIGIVWGGFGYTAMVQTPDGRGYTIQRGAKIGNNNGVVSAITEKAVIVEERFTDIYGKKQVREYAKPLHAKESLP
jgi:type IV pilus assembly protein PilP